MLTVLSWYWLQPKGRAVYKPEHVNIWANMVHRHLAMPHRVVCVTDLIEGLDPSIEIVPPPRDFEGVEIPTWGPSKPQCLRRLVMFRRDAATIFGERFVCMDLDCVVAGPLDPLFDTDAEFKIFKGTAGSRPYNGSMMLIKAGSRPQVYERFTVSAAADAGRRFVGSDQAWITYALGPKEPTWGPTDGVNFYNKRPPHPDTRLLFFPGATKPWTVVDENADPWVIKNYHGRFKSSRCLILGYADSVWDDAEKAIDTGPFAAVIASPEAAEHWPGDILAVADDDAHAERLARMHGFRDVVFCGRTIKQVA